MTLSSAFKKITYRCPASCKVSAIALLSVFSRSKTPHVACNTESRRQSPAERFQRACNLDPSLTLTSSDQLIMAASSSNSFWASRSINSEYNCSCIAGGKSSISVLDRIKKKRNWISIPEKKKLFYQMNFLLEKDKKKKKVCKMKYHGRSLLMIIGKNCKKSGEKKKKIYYGNRISIGVQSLPSSIIEKLGCYCFAKWEELFSKCHFFEDPNWLISPQEHSAVICF